MSNAATIPYRTQTDDDGGASPRSGGAPTPPLLTGGVEQQKPNILEDGPDHIGVDWLSVTVPTNTAEVLLHHTQHSEGGKPVRFFGATERRACFAGHAWRKYDPCSPARDWGLGWESWEFSGETAQHPAELLRGHEARPSRVDIAFDFKSSMIPSDLLPVLEPHCRETGIALAPEGEILPKDTRSVYVGSKSSERRLCIYRRDFRNVDQHLPDWAKDPPTLRVEVRLYKRAAQAWWCHRIQNNDTGYAVAARHVLDLSGLDMGQDFEDIPALGLVDDKREAIQIVYQFIRQHGMTVHALEANGISVAALSRIRAEACSAKSTLSRMQQKIDTCSQTPADQLQLTVSELIKRGERHA